MAWRIWRQIRQPPREPFIRQINLHDKVSTYLDGTPDTSKEITVRHLLTHTSGIVRDPSDYHPYDEQEPTEVIKAVYSVPLSFQPGEKWLYSNVGYYVLAEIITKASGEPWNHFIAERLFMPAHMTSTRTTTVSEIVPNRATGYQQRDNRMVNAENWIAVRPSGAFLSTVLDLAKWDAFLYSDNVLSAASRKMPVHAPDVEHASPCVGVLERRFGAWGHQADTAERVAHGLRDSVVGH